MSKPIASNHQKQLSTLQLSTLKGIVNGLLPPLSPPETDFEKAKNAPTKEIVRSFWEHDLSSDLDYMKALEESIQYKISSAESQLLRLLLNLMSTTLGTMLLFGTLSIKPFSRWSVSSQSAALRKLSRSRIQTKRKVFNGLKRLVCGLAFSFVPTDPALLHKSGNPFWQAMQYPGPYQWSVSAAEDARRVQKANSHIQRIEEALLKVGERDVELACDVVIVGSGAGGSVAASVLASEGFSVIVVEKGPFVPPLEISNLETDAFDRMYESHGLLTSQDGNIMILAGATLGGGTVINWSCCLPLPEHVREEWANKFDLEHFAVNHNFSKSMEIIMDQIGCKDKTGTRHNAMNQKLQMGCERLSYDWDVTGQNLRSSAGAASGYVCFGDRYGVKDNALSVFLTDAVDRGARLVHKCRVHKILRESFVSWHGRRGQRAKGIIGTVDGHCITIRARKGVICTAGSLHNPCLLKRSGFRNRHIGRHLHLHPTTPALGTFHGERIDCFLGAPMTTVCNAFEMGPRADGYGAKIECPSAHTGLMAAALPYVTPKMFKEGLLSLYSGAPLIAVQRDLGEGRVHCQLESDGFRPKIKYVLNRADKRSLTKTMEGLVKILLASGADEVFTGHIRDPGFRVRQNDHLSAPLTASDIEMDRSIAMYLRGIKKRGMAPHEIGVFSAHQMGTCRMSASPSKGVVDEYGELWECDDVYIMDASTFPTASGANPMLTTFAISHMISSMLTLKWRYQDGNLSSDSKVKDAEEMLRKRAAKRGMPFRQNAFFSL